MNRINIQGYYCIYSFMEILPHYLNFAKSLVYHLYSKEKVLKENSGEFQLYFTRRQKVKIRHKDNEECHSRVV